MEPTSSNPSLMRCADTQTISIVSPYIINIIIGIIKVITRFVKSMVLVNFLFASSKRSSSACSLPKARITGIPVRISLETKFNPSTSFCMSLNFGIAIIIKIETRPKINSTANPIIHPIPAPV